MFDVFDMESPHGRVYQALVSAPRSPVHAVAELAAVSPDAARESLRELQEADIALCLDTGQQVWEAKRPDIVAAGVLRRFEEKRAALHEVEDRLTQTFRFARSQQPDTMDIEVLHGVQATFERFDSIQRGARQLVRAVDRPPYYWDEAEMSRQENLQSAQMRAGVGYRTIYQDAESDSPRRSASMARTVADGESARALANPPIKVTIVDRSVAIMALDPPEGAQGVLVAMVVHRCALVDVLIEIFESLWRLAVPINLARMNEALSSRERQILTLMASGAGDDAIARRLGLSRRTIVRHIGQILEHLGTTTRFQAGAQAARRGWL